MPDNMERLREEGFTINTPMPEEYETVIQGLSGQEMDALIAVKRRLDEARVSLDEEELHYMNYILPL